MHPQPSEGVGMDIVCRKKERANRATFSFRLEVQDDQEWYMITVPQQLDRLALFTLLPMPVAIAIQAYGNGMTTEGMVMSPGIGESGNQK